MKQEEAYQIQRGDYFLYHGEIVKVVGRSPYNENDYSVENKNGSKFYAEVEELEPIILNEYILKQAGIYLEPESEKWYYYKDFVIIYSKGLLFVERVHKGVVQILTQHFHILQNTLRLLGEEIELKQ